MLSTLPILGFFGIWTLVETLRGQRPSRSWYLIFGYILSLAAGFVLYYRFFLREMWDQFSVLASRFGGGNSQIATTGGSAIPAPSEPFYEKLTRRVSSLVGLPATLGWPVWAGFAVGLPKVVRGPTSLFVGWTGKHGHFCCAGWGWRYSFFSSTRRLGMPCAGII